MSAANLADLSAVKSQLLATQHFLAIDGLEELGYHALPTDDVIAHLLAGYRLINRFLEEKIDLFSMGHSNALLEINLTVLYGAIDSPEREQHRVQIKNTERHFYDAPQGGVQELMEFYQRLLVKDPIQQAAELYVQTLLQPQLFIEGNHRTGTLLMSYVLQRHGYPPFVLTPENAYAYFISTDIARYRRNSLQIYFKRGALVKRVIALLNSAYEPANQPTAVER
jgi:prophage maintenance system killer protein